MRAPLLLPAGSTLEVRDHFGALIDRIVRSDAEVLIGRGVLLPIGNRAVKYLKLAPGVTWQAMSLRGDNMRRTRNDAGEIIPARVGCGFEHVDLRHSFRKGQ